MRGENVRDRRIQLGRHPGPSPTDSASTSCEQLLSSPLKGNGNSQMVRTPQAVHTIDQ
jgi:hypothetical protein